MTEQCPKCGEEMEFVGRAYTGIPVYRFKCPECVGKKDFLASTYDISTLDTEMT